MVPAQGLIRQDCRALNVQEHPSLFGKILQCSTISTMVLSSEHLEASGNSAIVLLVKLSPNVLVSVSPTELKSLSLRTVRGGTCLWDLGEIRYCYL